MIRVDVPPDFTETLNRSSVTKRCYPWDVNVIDWSAPIDDEHDYMPTGFSFVDGTELERTLSPEQRSFVTRWEFTSLMRNQTQGEHILNQALLGVLYHIDPYDPAYRYLLHEVAEECQHMSMFNDWVRRNSDIRTQGMGQDQMGPLVSVLTPVVASRFPALLWAMTFLFEVFGDHMARAAARDPSPRLHPIVRQLMRAHVIEEARHVAFAREWLQRLYERMSAPGKRALAVIAESTLAAILRLNFPFVPLFYSAQLQPLVSRRAFRRALQSDHRRALLQSQVGSAVVVLRGVGVIRERTLERWHRRGMLPGERIRAAGII